ncbi:hypothetical protein [Winogradskyella sp. 3972H.M.0a.05]|uniref:hypothetical protein n=1 Tax=Winogradskyella sp. 3972H.M.0a.05 TaxID=2950277 RepID=UPI003395BB3F
MYKKIITLVIASIINLSLIAQSDIKKSTSEQIKEERNAELEIKDSILKQIDIDIENLNELLNKSKKRKEKLETLEKLHLALETRIKYLEEYPKTKIKFNGQLAFTELLSIQRDIKPADLFSQSQIFFTELDKISNVNQYHSFTHWQSEYYKFYERRKGKSDFIELLNNSIKLITDTSNDVPLFGSIFQTAVSGISYLLTSLGNRDKDLLQKTPDLILLLNSISQFEQQKEIIDFEWLTINEDLEQLKKENNEILMEQIIYYNLSLKGLEKYLKTTIEAERDEYKFECRESIAKKLNELDNTPESKWLAEVETFMYRVQSLRLRFGELTHRMLANIENYEKIIKAYSNNSIFPLEFTNRINSIGNSLSLVRSKFYETFNPDNYIKDSAIMYLGRM